jgi:hypothetical protein
VVFLMGWILVVLLLFLVVYGKSGMRVATVNVGFGRRFTI